MSRFEIILRALGRSLRRRNLPYMIIGGQAVLLYGEPRLTRDIDVTLGASTERFDDAAACAADLGLKPLPDSPRAFAEETMVLPCIEEASGIRVDFIFSTSLYEQEAIGRARVVEVGEEKVAFASPEDLLIHKMVAGRPRDLEDVASVLARNPDLDLDLVRRWLKEFEPVMEGRSPVEEFGELLRQRKTPAG